MKVLRVLMLAVAVSAVLVVAGPGRPGQAGAAATSSARTLTVTSTGSATAVPDRAAFSFGVTSQAKTAAGALAANGVEMRKVIAALKGAGVLAKDLQTESVSLSPRYSGNGEDIVGYTASNTVNAEIKGIGRVGSVIDVAVKAGANQVFGPSFTVSEQASLYRRALRTAVAAARVKAASLAGAAHVRLGPVRTIVESSSSPVPIAEKAAADATPIEAGTQSIEASVTVEFAIR